MIKKVAIFASVGIIFAVIWLWQVNRVSLAAETNEIYLPLVSRNFPPPPTVFGAEVVTFTDPDLIQLAADMRLSWVSIPAFDWSKIEPNAPVDGAHTYDWSQVPESSLRNIGAQHMYTIATIKMTPLWAQKDPGVYCGPVSRDHFGDFATFVRTVVRRYSRPPTIYAIGNWGMSLMWIRS